MLPSIRRMERQISQMLTREGAQAAMLDFVARRQKIRVYNPMFPCNIFCFFGSVSTPALAARRDLVQVRVCTADLVSAPCVEELPRTISMETMPCQCTCQRQTSSTSASAPTSTSAPVRSPCSGSEGAKKRRREGARSIYMP